MKRTILALVATLALAMAALAQAPISNGRYYASQFGAYSVPLASGNSATGAGKSVTLVQAYVTLPGGVTFFPFASASVPVTVTGDGNADTFTPSSTSGCAASGSACSITGTISHTHSARNTVTSGTFGLAEAVLTAKSAGGGVVVVDNRFGGSTSTITGLAVGGATVAIEDIRSAPVWYVWNGTAYLANNGAGVMSTANGAAISFFVTTEEIAAPTSGTTTDSVANLLPANSLILGVSGRVTVAITGGTCSSWQLGDPTTAGRFMAADSTLTANETKVGGVQLTTGVASATTGMFQAAAAKVRLTCGTGAAAAGKVRVTVWGITVAPPTS